MARPTSPILIEQTAKRWKRIQLAGLIVLVASMIAGIGILWLPLSSWKADAFLVALFCAIAGGAISQAGRLLAWWHHG